MYGILWTDFGIGAVIVAAIAARRFLLSQEWSAGNAKESPKYAADCPPPPTMPKYAHTLPFPPQTIPAKAGISQPYAANGGVSYAAGDNNAAIGDNWHAACGGFYVALPPFIVRFLPTQEWSTCVRDIVDGFWLWAVIVAAIAARRFLLPQEWSRGERKCIGESSNCRPPNCRQHQTPIRRQSPVPRKTIPA